MDREKREELLGLADNPHCVAIFNYVKTRGNGAIIKEVAKGSDMSSGRTSKHLQYMEKVGLVIRKISGSCKHTYIASTEEAREFEKIIKKLNQ